MSMSTQPKVLLIESDEKAAEGLCFAAEGFFDMAVECSAEQAVNRIGFEDFDLVVLDAQLDNLLITTKVIESFRRLHIPFMLLGKKLPGMNGYPVLSKRDGKYFVDKVSGLLGLVRT